MSKMKSLKDRVQEFTAQLPIMEGREKGDMERLHNDVFTIEDYGFLSDGEKEYACFIVKEDKQNFYFGGMVLTEQLQQLEAEGYHDSVVAEGLPVEFGTKKGKNKLNYTTVKFYPEVAESTKKGK